MLAAPTETQSQLLRAILLDPADDTARLVYADWLEENGEAARAEFIRVQCQLAKWSCNFKQTKEQPGWFHDCGTDERGYWLCQPLRSRERELWDYWPNWVRSLPLIPFHNHHEFNTVAKGHMAVVWERGFIASVVLLLAEFEDHAASIFAAHPVTSVRLSDRQTYSNTGPTWYRRGRTTPSALVPERAEIPRSLFNLLPEYDRGVDRWKTYSSDESAHAALSAACVQWGRELAGLPPLS